MKRFGLAAAEVAIATSIVFSSPETPPPEATGALVVSTDEASRSATQPTRLPEVSTLSQTQRVFQAFDEVRSYWQQQGKDLSGVHLQFLEGDETFSCHRGNKAIINTAYGIKAARGRRTADYCFPQHTIIVGEVALTALEQFGSRTGVSPYAAAKLMVAHEMGHAIQDKQGEYGPAVNTGSEIRAKEQQADRLAGQALSHDSGAINAVPTLFLGLTPFPNKLYTSAEQRTADFNQGIADGE